MYLKFYIEVTAAPLGFKKHNAFYSMNCQYQDIGLGKEN